MNLQDIQKHECFLDQPSIQLHTQISINHYIKSRMQIFKHNKWSITNSVVEAHQFKVETTINE
jgi:hypothetical protein